jgi:hypothetical protein
VGLRLAVGPDGETLALSETEPAEPLTSAVLIVDVALAPGRIERVLELALIEKLLPGVTVSVTVVLCKTLPSAPVIFTE